MTTTNNTNGAKEMKTELEKLAQAVADNMSKSQIEEFLNVMTEGQQNSYAAQLGIEQCKRFISMGVELHTNEETNRKFVKMISCEF